MQQRSIAWLMVAVLALQAYLMIQVAGLRREQQHAASQLQNRMGMVDSRVGSLESQITMMTREAQWVRDMRERVESVPGCGGGTVTVDWTFRDLTPGAQVQLLYREAGQTQWQAVDARPTGGLGYAAGFPVTGLVRGNISWEVGRQAGTSGMEVSSVAPGNQPEQGNRYEYRVVAWEAGQERGSDLFYLDAAKLFLTWFQARVQVLSDNRYVVTVMLDQQKPDEKDACRTVAGAAIRGYRGGSRVAEQDLGPNFHAELKTAQPLDQMELVVRYASGTEEVHHVPLR